MNHLRDLYSKVSKIERKKEPEKYRVRRIEQELLKKNPDVRIDRELLSLVGTDPYSPPSQDKEIVRRVAAERYG